MACPNCGCKVTYQYDDEDAGQGPDYWERCAACGHIFDAEEAADEDDDELMDDATRYAVLGGA